MFNKWNTEQLLYEVPVLGSLYTHIGSTHIQMSIIYSHFELKECERTNKTKSGYVSTRVTDLVFQ